MRSKHWAIVVTFISAALAGAQEGATERMARVRKAHPLTAKENERQLAQSAATIQAQAKVQAQADTAEADFAKTLCDPAVLKTLTEALAGAYTFVTERGAFPYKTYSTKSTEARFAMRSMTYQQAKQLKAQPLLAPYFTPTAKVENIFHELRFENLVVRDGEKIAANYFRSYFRLRYPNSDKGFVFMMEWNPQDSSSEGLKIYSIPGATDALNLGEAAVRARLGLQREEIKAVSKSHQLLRKYLEGLAEERDQFSGEKVRSE